MASTTFFARTGPLLVCTVKSPSLPSIFSTFVPVLMVIWAFWMAVSQLSSSCSFEMSGAPNLPK